MYDTKMAEFVINALNKSNKTVLEQLGAFILYQTSGVFHPMTCGTDSRHPNLVPVLENDLKTIHWECPACDYKQSFTPI